MEGVFILLVAALVVCVQGTSHLSFSNNTEVNITLDGCGVTKLCLSTPDSCDPAGQSACLFASAAVVTTSPPVADSVELAVELRGDSGGYIALGLISSTSPGTTMLFVCAANTTNNGAIFFRTLQRNNTDEALIPTETRVKEIRGTVAGTVIKCEFNIESLNATNIFNVLLGTGAVNGTAVGPFNIDLDAGAVILTTTMTDTTVTGTTVTNTTVTDTTVTNTTVTGTTVTGTTVTNTTVTGSGGAVRPHAVLLLLSVLTLSVMLRA